MAADITGTRIATFNLPDVGEGLTEAEILTWHVAAGDAVAVNQIIVEIETAKAAVELPSPYAGRVHALLAEPGVTIAVGTPIIQIDTDPGAGPVPDDDRATGSGGHSGGTADSGSGSGGHSGGAGGSEPAGARATMHLRRLQTPRRLPRRAAPRSARPWLTGGWPPLSVTFPPPAVALDGPSVATVVKRPCRARLRRQVGEVPVSGATAPTAAVPRAPLATPPVRKLAKDLGIDLAAVSPTRADGVISRADVQAAVSGAGASSPGTVMSPDASQWGREALAVESAGSTAPRSEASWPAGGRYDPATRETRLPVKGVRKMMAAAMVSSAFTAPHVTEFLTVDVTPMMELRERLKSRREFAGLKITPLTFAARAVCIASRRTPEANAAWDGDAGEIVYRDFVNLGIAAATARGLIVPVIRDADRLSVSGLALGLAQLTDTAREGKTSPAEMTGGTITITNVGVFGVDTGTPIINPGESAILALGSIKDAPWVVDGHLAVRKVCQLALSFDHRVMDGQQGSQFLADVGALLADPGLAMVF